MDCVACERIDQIQRGKNPYFLAELRESYAVLADDQRYEGYCILLLKSHEEHLEALPTARQLALFEDVSEIAKAITLAFEPTRLNYECLGNSLAHIHWHVIPRYAWDPEPTQPIWIRPKEERRTGIEPDILRDLICKLEEQLKAIKMV